MSVAHQALFLESVSWLPVLYGSGTAPAGERGDGTRGGVTPTSLAHRPEESLLLNMHARIEAHERGTMLFFDAPGVPASKAKNGT